MPETMLFDTTEYVGIQHVFK